MTPPPCSRLPLLAALLLAAVAAAQGPEGLRARGSVLPVVETDASDRDLRMTPVVRAVQRAADSVVSIYLQAPGRRAPITAGQGSGVILDDSGLAITNWHVVARALDSGERGVTLGVEARLRDGRVRKAQVLSTSRRHDLALLQLRLENGEKVKPVEIGRSSDLMIGETLLAIGNPQGHANTVTSGVLSAIGREIRVSGPDGSELAFDNLLQTDAAINQGNSGGALLDITGKLVGINNAVAANAENIGFAIPMDVVREVFEKELVQSSSFATAADSAWLGIEVADREGRVVVSDVLRGGPAEKAGIAAGDVIVKLGDQPVRSGLDYQRHLIDARVAQPFPILVRRGDAEVRLVAAPTSATLGAILRFVGAEFEEVDARADAELLRKATLAVYRRSGLGRVVMLPSTLRVAAVLPGSPAEALGLRAGDALVSVSLVAGYREREQPVLSLRDLAFVLQQHAGRSLRVNVLRDDDELVGTLDVRPANGR